jgi:hypothetical protein
MDEHTSRDEVHHDLEQLLTRHGIVPWRNEPSTRAGNIEARLRFVYHVFYALMALEIAAILIFILMVIFG